MGSLLTPPLYYIGLMSGTSSDAIDAALILLTPNTAKLIAHHSQPIANAKRQLIINLFTPGSNEIQKMGMLDTYLGHSFAKACLQLLMKSQIPAEKIRAIGSHGQTIRHHPNGTHPFTLQIGDPNIIAELTGITTVADFRRRDLALGGQGAPLAPGFHAFLLNSHPVNSWVLNIGGIANLTYKPAKDSTILGFDTGPGNCLLDAWCNLHRHEAYDDKGQWALQGHCHPRLLKQFLNDPYFKRSPPKSTGREYFNLQWLQKQLSVLNEKIKLADVQATLLELTAHSIYLAIKNYDKKASDLFICGGGYYNDALIQRLSELCIDLNIQSSEALGIPPQWMEAAAFAWLAHQTLEGQYNNLPTVTGARSATILGSIYPGMRKSIFCIE
jgi:anhydro-N-acetylmuramic acid kinase